MKIHVWDLDAGVILGGQQLELGLGVSGRDHIPHSRARLCGSHASVPGILFRKKNQEVLRGLCS